MPKHKSIKFETSLEPSLKKEVEKIIKNNKKAKTVLNATLAIMAVGGVITLGVMAPGVLGEISRLAHRKKKQRNDQYREIWKNFNYLKKEGNLELIKEEDNKLIYKFSKKGKERIRKFILDELKVETPKKWDGRWRLVLFDIPETRRKARAALSRKLKDMEFYQCQKSVWIYPFECREEINFLKDIFNIKPFVKIFTVDEIDDGKVLYYFRDHIK